MILFSNFTSCDKVKDNDTIHANAIVIGFNPEKCECCWGWIIQMGNDTIKTNNIIVGKTVGYEINEPISVYMELGDKEEDCHAFSRLNPTNNKDYFEIKEIKKIKE